MMETQARYVAVNIMEFYNFTPANQFFTLCEHLVAFMSMEDTFILKITIFMHWTGSQALIDRSISVINKYIFITEFILG